MPEDSSQSEEPDESLEDSLLGMLSTKPPEEQVRIIKALKASVRDESIKEVIAELMFEAEAATRPTYTIEEAAEYLSEGPKDYSPKYVRDMVLFDNRTKESCIASHDVFLEAVEGYNTDYNFNAVRRQLGLSHTAFRKRLQPFMEVGLVREVASYLGMTKPKLYYYCLAQGEGKVKRFRAALGLS
jgi:hypothetical protein